MLDLLKALGLLLLFTVPGFTMGLIVALEHAKENPCPVEEEYPPGEWDDMLLGI